MGFLRRLRGKDGEVPWWAPSFTTGQYAEFLQEARAALGDRLISPDVLDGGGLRVKVDAENDGVVGLSNVAQVCFGLPREEWAAAIREHFAAVVLPTAEAPPDFDTAAPLLRLRLVPDEFEQPNDDGTSDLLAERLATGLRSVLVLDLPKSIRYLTRTAASSWDRSDEELFKIATDNLRRHERPDIERAPDNPNVSILSGDGYYVASNLVVIGELVALPPNGAVVVVPNRHVLLAHDVSDMSIVTGVQMLVGFAAHAYRDGPGSISPNLYWVHGGRIELIPTQFDRGKASIYPPDSFVEVLNSLPAPPSNRGS
jgi:hypothetical protein